MEIKKIRISDFEIVVIGGSVGSIHILTKLIPLIPENFPLPVLVVVHRKAGNYNVLHNILQNKSRIRVKEADDKEPIKAGVVYLAPPDYHMLIEDEKTICLDFSEKENFSRPNNNLLFSIVASV